MYENQQENDNQNPLLPDFMAHVHTLLLLLHVQGDIDCL